MYSNFQLGCQILLLAICIYLGFCAVREQLSGHLTFRTRGAVIAGLITLACIAFLTVCGAFSQLVTITLSLRIS